MLDHDYGDIARDAVEQYTHGLALGMGEAGKWLIEQQEPGLLRQRHGQLEPAPLAIRGLDHDPLCAVAKTNAPERVVRGRVEVPIGGEDRPRIPSSAIKTEE